MPRQESDTRIPIIIHNFSDSIGTTPTCCLELIHVEDHANLPADTFNLFINALNPSLYVFGSGIKSMKDNFSEGIGMALTGCLAPIHVGLC